MTAEERIRKYLDEQGITQTSVARKIGITKSQLCQSLNGKRKLTLDEVVRICEVLRKTPNDFLWTEKGWEVKGT